MDRQEASVNRRDWNPVEHYKDIEIAERYDADRFASLAGRVFDALEKRNIRKTFRDLPVSARIVDIPCGTGRLAEVLLDCGYHVTGIDVSPAMLEVARRKLARFGDRFSTQVCDARKLGDLGKSFDAALCARVLMHFPLSEQITFLGSIAAVISGRVVFTQSYDTPYQRSRRWFKQLLRHQKSTSYPITESALQKLLAETGLREVRRLRVLPLVSEAIAVITEKD